MQGGRAGKTDWFVPALLVALILGLLVLPTALLADTIFLKNGRRIIADSVTETGDKVYYESGFGRVSIPKSLVDRIEKGGPVPERQLAVPPEGSGPQSQAADLPPAGIRIALDSRLMGSILHGDAVDEEVLAELASKAQQSDLDRGNAVNAYLLAALYEAHNNRIGEASHWAEQALLTDGFDHNALLVAAQLDLARRQYTEALRHMQVAYGMTPDSPDVLTLLGDAYYFSEGAERALDYWQQAYALRPDVQLQERIERVEKEAAVERDLDQAASFHFVLSWQGSPSNSRFGNDVLEGLEKMFRELEVALDFSPREPVTVILYGSEQFADITRAPSWAGALNDGKIRVPVQGLSGLSPGLARVLKHELTHSFIYQITEGRCPTWFNEGLAQFEAGEPLNEFGRELVAARSQLLPLRKLEGSFQGFDFTQAFLAYGETLAAVKMIHDQYGPYQLPDLLRALHRGESMSEALHSVLRMSYEDTDQEMAAYLARHYEK
jgi:tetratricopeptide (TPR) repeat protein